MDDENLGERVDELEDLLNLNDDKSEELADNHTGWLIANQALTSALLNYMISQSDNKKLLLEHIWLSARTSVQDRPIFPLADPDSADLCRRLASERIDLFIASLAARWLVKERA